MKRWDFAWKYGWKPRLLRSLFSHVSRDEQKCISLGIFLCESKRGKNQFPEERYWLFHFYLFRVEVGIKIWMRMGFLWLCYIIQGCQKMMISDICCLCESRILWKHFMTFSQCNCILHWIATRHARLGLKLWYSEEITTHWTTHGVY